MLILLFFFNLTRNIITKRLLCQVVTCHGIGAGPAAAADIHVFTGSTVVFVSFEIPHFSKEPGVFPHLFERLLLKISCRFWKVAAGEHIEIHINKTDELTGQTAFGTTGGKL